MCMLARFGGTGPARCGALPHQATAGGTMPGHDECPGWCAEDVIGPDGVLHRVVLGDVRLVQTGGSTTCQVRRRRGRGPEQQDRLHPSLAAAARLMGLEDRRRRVVFRGNWAVPAPEAAEDAPAVGREGSVGAAV